MKEKQSKNDSKKFSGDELIRNGRSWNADPSYSAADRRVWYTIVCSPAFRI